MNNIEQLYNSEYCFVLVSSSNKRFVHLMQDAVDTEFNEHVILVFAVAGNEGNEEGSGNLVLSVKAFSQSSRLSNHYENNVIT